MLKAGFLILHIKCTDSKQEVRGMADIFFNQLETLNHFVCSRLALLRRLWEWVFGEKWWKLAKLLKLLLANSLQAILPLAGIFPEIKPRLIVDLYI